MTPTPPRGRALVRRARAADIEAVTEVFLAAIGAVDFLPRLYTEEQERWFIRHDVFAEADVWLAECGGTIAGFLALQKNEIRLLFCHPTRQGKGLGAAMIAQAKSLDRPYLDLWCFRDNDGARRFYERQGFRAVEWTDGKRNEERLPDVRYFWQPRAVSAADP